jgi:hypothetical protein
MLGSWMGTDVTNDDLAEESSLRKHFVARIVRRSDSPVAGGSRSPSHHPDQLEARGAVLPKGRSVGGKIGVYMSHVDMPDDVRRMTQHRRRSARQRSDRMRRGEAGANRLSNVPHCRGVSAARDGAPPRLPPQSSPPSSAERT